MTQEGVLRRLSAILAADVVGYSRLMAADEVGTLARFRRIRADVIDPMIARFQGRIVGSAGDSLLVEFTSALSAVQCAVMCQNDLNRINALEPEERRISFRMGINLGDVIAADETIHGDGVNVAARLEKLAEPGGLCISRNVHDQVQNKLDLRFTDFGEHQVKNIVQPIRVFRAELVNQPKAVPAIDASVNKELARSEKVSIAVLPFDNMSGDPDQSYFSDGITEDIITELSRFRELLVIARNSSFRFRGEEGDVKEVAKKLDVQFLVRGSIRKLDQRFRLTVQLVDTASGANIWAERYDQDLTEIFDVQDTLTRMVTTQIALQTKSAVVHRKRSLPTESLSAYDYFLRAREMHAKYETQLQTEPLLEKALELDPRFAVAHALMSFAQSAKYFNDAKVTHLDDAVASATRALDLDPTEPLANCALGYALMNLRRFDEAKYYFDQAVSLNQNDASFLVFHAMWMTYAGQTDVAFREIEEAFRRDPYNTNWFWDALGTTQTVAGLYRQAIESFQKINPVPPWGYCYMAIAYGELGEMAKARECLKRLDQRHGGRTPENILLAEPFADTAVQERLVSALRRMVDR